LDPAVQTDRDEPAAVRIKGHTADLVHMSLVNSWTGVGGGVPQSNRLVRAGRCNRAPVGAKRHPVEPVGVAEVTRHLLTGVKIPHLQHLIMTAGGEPFAVRAESHASYLRSMARQYAQLLAAGDLPYLHGSVHAG